MLSSSRLLAAAPAVAQSAGAEPQPSETQKQFQAIQWTQGPAKVGIGGHAEIQVPEGFAYTGASGAQKLLELMHNPTSGTELGILTDKDLDIFVLFEFEESGYVKDAEKEKLDGDDLLKAIREGNEASNEARKERGWPAITIVGWHTPPFYNRETNNLEWCIKGESEGHTIVNYNTRILGRQGVMSANLMVDPEKLDATLPVMKKLLGGYTLRRGQALLAIRDGRQDREVRPLGAGRRRRGRPGGEGGTAGQARRSCWASSGRRSSSASSASGSAIKKFLFGRKETPPDSPQSPPPQVTG